MYIYIPISCNIIFRVCIILFTCSYIDVDVRCDTMIIFITFIRLIGTQHVTLTALMERNGNALRRRSFAEESLPGELLTVRPNISPQCVNITEIIDFPLYLNHVRDRWSITVATSKSVWL